MKITEAKVFTKTHKFEARELYVIGERICSEADYNVQKGPNSGENGDDDIVIAAPDLYAIPGLVDIHFHGAMGQDFCEADAEGLRTIARYEAEHGVLAICPATMTYGEEKLSGIMKNARDFADNNTLEADLVGINMEGPFISPDKIGAQNPKFLHLPDAEMFRRLQKESGGLIKLVDMAPELEGSQEFIKELAKEINISIAHTNADYDVAKEAFEIGARHVTHLFNAMPGINHRNPGPIIAAKEAHAEVEIITDGIHVHPAMVRTAFEMFDEGKVCIISDSMEATGLPDGEYQLGGQAVTVHGKRAVLKDNPDTIAGSATNLFDCMACAVKVMGIPLEKAVRAASENPARAIGIDGDYGSLDAGKYANILLIDKDLNLKYIIKKGQLLK
ncbi:N-acetylglucosamine-6-phosphate deacetylase [Butyrivibrio sp. VCB2006]|uniref:N-acetylglucosamine-6-phosphate deacetylase n=1 Tax=Butyrivibrio sp. VCB2006 TaxID=1280679 RepID=UPI000425E4E3|nr:N-acetylglucosamine-6-phosphate deacetylase [Butyrivibrio sp. VCB2006]